MNEGRSHQDKVFIRDLAVQAILGILPAERVTPQRVILNLAVATDTRRAAKSRDIAQALNYAELAEAAKQLTVTGEYLLIETLVEDLAALCLAQPGAQAVTVNVCKPEAVADASAVGVEIFRSN
ncbi:MAG: dihydroneopterin aldolase [Proteobacteria bacterium]|nr:dihydroneopterin aldolase [Pseudomonadota bacterium]